jgi:hypothetical protein
MACLSISGPGTMEPEPVVMEAETDPEAQDQDMLDDYMTPGSPLSSLFDSDSPPRILSPSPQTLPPVPSQLAPAAAPSLPHTPGGLLDSPNAASASASLRGESLRPSAEPITAGEPQIHNIFRQFHSDGTGLQIMTNPNWLPICPSLLGPWGRKLLQF